MCAHCNGCENWAKYGWENFEAITEGFRRQFHLPHSSMQLHGQRVIQGMEEANYEVTKLGKCEQLREDYGYQNG